MIFQYLNTVAKLSHSEIVAMPCDALDMYLPQADEPMPFVEMSEEEYAIYKVARQKSIEAIGKPLTPIEFRNGRRA